MFLSLRLLFLMNLILGMFFGIPIHFSNENNGLQLAYFVNNDNNNLLVVLGSKQGGKLKTVNPKQKG